MRMLENCKSWKCFLISVGSNIDNEVPLGLDCIVVFSLYMEIEFLILEMYFRVEGGR